MSNRIIRIATRQSPLALQQANHVRTLLLKYWPKHHIELLPLLTSGDKYLKDKLPAGKGLFVKELEEALLDHRACLAVHSTKDMTIDCPKGLLLAAICKRDNPLDAFISNNYACLDELPPKAIVGTTSLRRQSQLLAYRSDLKVQPLRGNIHTRLMKLERGPFDALILAAAGLERMGLESRIRQILAEELMLPACGQGALCIECRSDDLEIQHIVNTVNHYLSSICIHAERRVNLFLGGNCHTPMAIFCKPISETELRISAKIGAIDGSQFIEDSQSGLLTESQQLADRCIQALVAKGAQNFLQISS